MTQLPTTLLDACQDAFKAVRRSVWDAARLLHQIQMNEAWRGHFESYSDFVDELGVSRGFASKLLTAYTHFVVEGGVSPEKLAGLDYERAYMATKLEGSVEKQLSKALTLTRRELKEEKNDEAPHDHQWNTYCTICGIKHP